jgi:hypothetical protein
MTLEELALLKRLSEEISAIQKALLEIRTMFERFTNEKEVRWKDEAARRRERCW